MKRVIFAAFAAAALLASCSKDAEIEASVSGGAVIGEEVTIGISNSSVEYTPLPTSGRSVDAGDLLAIQIYEVESEVATPYAYGVFTTMEDLSFTGYVGETYKVVATVVKDGQSEVDATGGVYAKPFDSAITADFIYSSSDEMSGVSESTTTIGGVDYTRPAVDRYYGVASSQVTSANESIGIYFKRVAFGISTTLDNDTAVISLAGANDVALAEIPTSGYFIYTFADIEAAYSADESMVNYSESVEVTITNNSLTLFNESVTFYRNKGAELSCDGSGNYSFSFDFETPFEGQYCTLTFEDADYAGSATSYWSSLIDPLEYGGSLLYNNYTGYAWVDTNNTGLMSGMGGTDFWYGGIVLSNYYREVSGSDYTKQLSIPWKDAETGYCGYNGSENFAILFDGSSMGGVYSALSFDEGVEATIQSMYIANTSYAISECEAGYFYISDEVQQTGLGDTDWFKVTATGYDAEGEMTSSLELFLAEEGVTLDGWNKWDLSTLGKVNKVEFVFDSSVWSTGTWAGSLVPSYAAIDNISVIL